MSVIAYADGKFICDRYMSGDINRPDSQAKKYHISENKKVILLACGHTPEKLHDDVDLASKLETTEEIISALSEAINYKNCKALISLSGELFYLNPKREKGEDGKLIRVGTKSEALSRATKFVSGSVSDEYKVAWLVIPDMSLGEIHAMAAAHNGSVSASYDIIDVDTAEVVSCEHKRQTRALSPVLPRKLKTIPTSTAVIDRSSITVSKGLSANLETPIGVISIPGLRMFSMGSERLSVAALKREKLENIVYPQTQQYLCVDRYGTVFHFILGVTSPFIRPVPTTDHLYAVSSWNNDANAINMALGMGIPAEAIFEAMIERGGCQRSEAVTYDLNEIVSEINQELDEMEDSSEVIDNSFLAITKRMAKKKMFDEE